MPPKGKWKKHQRFRMPGTFGEAPDADAEPDFSTDRDTRPPSLLLPRPPPLGEMYYGCPYCPFSARYEGSLFKHLKKSHPGAPKRIERRARPLTDPPYYPFGPPDARARVPEQEEGSGRRGGRGNPAKPPPPQPPPIPTTLTRLMARLQGGFTPMEIAHWWVGVVEGGEHPEAVAAIEARVRNEGQGMFDGLVRALKANAFEHPIGGAPEDWWYHLSVRQFLIQALMNMEDPEEPEHQGPLVAQGKPRRMRGGALSAEEADFVKGRVNFLMAAHRAGGDVLISALGTIPTFSAFTDDIMGRRPMLNRADVFTEVRKLVLEAIEEDVAAPGAPSGNDGRRDGGDDDPVAYADGKGKPIVIPEKDFIEEHKRLIKTLLSGKKAELTKEAKGQMKELKHEMKARGGKAPWRYAHKAPDYFDFK